MQDWKTVHILGMEAGTVNIENQGEITIEDLVKNSLRQMPGGIIVRKSEARKQLIIHCTEYWTLMFWNRMPTVPVKPLPCLQMLP